MKRRDFLQLLALLAFLERTSWQANAQDSDIPITDEQNTPPSTDSFRARLRAEIILEQIKNKDTSDLPGINPLLDQKERLRLFTNMARVVKEIETKKGQIFDENGNVIDHNATYQNVETIMAGDLFQSSPELFEQGRELFGKTVEERVKADRDMALEIAGDAAGLIPGVDSRAEKVVKYIGEVAEATTPSYEDFMGQGAILDAVSIRFVEILHKEFQRDPRIRETLAASGYRSITDLIASDADTEDLLQNVEDQKLKTIFEKALAANAATTEEEKARLGQELLEPLYAHITNATEDLRQAIGNEIAASEEAIAATTEAALRKVLAEEKAERIKQKRLQGEINGAFHIGEFLAGELLPPKKAKLVQKSLRAIQQSAALASAIQAGTMGPLGMASGFLTITQGFMGGPSAEEMILEAIEGVYDAVHDVHMAVIEVHKTLLMIREEMHERFDRLEAGQKKIMQQNEEILQSIRDANRDRDLQYRALQKGLRALRNMTRFGREEDERSWQQDAPDDLRLAIRDVRSEIGRIENGGNVDVGVLNEALARAIDFALSEGRKAYLNGSGLDEWESARIREALLTATGVTSEIHTAKLIYENAIDGIDRFNPPNPAIWQEGTQAFLEIVTLFPELLENRTNRQRLASLYQAGVALEQFFQRATSPETMEMISRRIQDGDYWGRFFDPIIENFLIERGLPSDAPILPVPQPYDDELKTGATYEVSSFAEMPGRDNGPGGEKVAQFMVNEWDYYDAFHMIESRTPADQRGGSFGMFFDVWKDNNPLTIGQKLGLLRLEKVEHTRRRVYGAQSETDRSIRYDWEELNFYHIHFDGFRSPSPLAGQVFGHGKEGLLQGGVDRAGRERVWYISANMYETNLGGHTIRNTADLLRVIYAEIAKEYEHIRTELIERIKLEFDGTTIFDDLNTDMLCLKLLIGLREWASGTDEKACARFLKGNSLPSSPEDIKAVFETIMSDKEAPTKPTYQRRAPGTGFDRLTDYAVTRIGNETVQDTKLMIHEYKTDAETPWRPGGAFAATLHATRVLHEAAQAKYNDGNQLIGNFMQSIMSDDSARGLAE